MMKWIVATSFIFAVNTAYAAQQTTTLAIPGMDCEVCPVTVKKALLKVPGVSKVKVSFKDKNAVVVFDDKLATPEKLMRATTDAGYPSTVEGAPK